MMSTSDTNPTVETVRRLAVHAASSAMQQMQHQSYQHFAPQYEQIHVAQESFVGIFPVLKRVIYYTVVGSFLIMTSMGTYGLFYLVAMPPHAATEQLYFDYSCRGGAFATNETTACAMNDTSTCVKDHASLCTPTATVDIFAEHTPWEALHPDVVPEARSKSSILKANRHYFLEVLLQLPESSVNQDSGMFAVEVELRSDVPLARSKRSARLPHESGWVGAVRKILCLAPLLVGAMTESRTVIIPAFRHFVESSKHPLGVSWRTQVPVEVVAGELRIGKELNWFQTILKEWFWTSFMIGTLIILATQSIIFWIASFAWGAWKEKLQRDLDESIDLGDQPYFFDSTPPHSTAAAASATDPHFVDDDSDWEPTVQEDAAPVVEEPVEEVINDQPIEET